MALTSEERAGVWARAMEQLSALRVLCTAPKGDLHTAVGVSDQWLDDNLPLLNALLPLSVQALPVGIKLRLLMLVLLRRLGGN